MFIAFLCLFACSQKSEPATAKPAAPAPAVHLDPIVRVRKVKNDLSTQMHAIVDKVKRHDQSTGEEADRLMDFLDHRLGAAAFDGVVENRPTYTAQDSCLELPCGHFVIASITSNQGFSAGMWAPDFRDLVVDPKMNPNDAYAPFLIFHELFHATDPRATGTLADYSVNDVAVPEETDAIGLESRLTEAWSNGAWGRIIGRMADDVEQSRVKIVVDDHLIAAPIPREVGMLFTRNGEPMSEGSLKAVVYLAIYDLNRELIRRSHLSKADETEAFALLYSRCAHGDRNQQANVLLVASVQSWSRPDGYSIARP